MFVGVFLQLTRSELSKKDWVFAVGGVGAVWALVEALVLNDVGTNYRLFLWCRFTPTSARRRNAVLVRVHTAEDQYEYAPVEYDREREAQWFTFRKVKYVYNADERCFR